MRIIAGRHRGRRLAAPPGRDVRPTSDRMREALFGILVHSTPALRGATFLDAFAGSGAVGLEALSQGAEAAVFIENDRAALDALRRNIAHLGEELRCRILATDATSAGPAPTPCDVLFLDPPYRSGLAGPALEALMAEGWLTPHARIVVELAASEEIDLPRGLRVEQERRYGAGRLVFCRRDDDLRADP